MIINKRKIINLEYCVFSILFGKKRIKANNDVVFIPFFGRLGDMVMFLSTLQELKKLFVIRVSIVEATASHTSSKLMVEA